MFASDSRAFGRVRRSMCVAAAFCVIAALAGCTAGHDSAAAGGQHPTPSATRTVQTAACLAGMDVHPVLVKGIGVQLIGRSDRAVVISNESGDIMCNWVTLAHALVGAGYEVALYQYLGTARGNAATVLNYVRDHGASKAALLGGSEGAKASIVAAARAKPAPDALVSLSAEGYIEGLDVADSADMLTCPTLYVTADHDPYGSTSATENFQKVTKTGLSTLIVVPGADHGHALLKDDGIQQKVLEFLDAHLQ